MVGLVYYDLRTYSKLRKEPSVPYAAKVEYYTQHTDKQRNPVLICFPNVSIATFDKCEKVFRVHTDNFSHNTRPMNMSSGYKLGLVLYCLRRSRDNWTTMHMLPGIIHLDSGCSNVR